MGQRWKAERSTIQRTAGQGYERSVPGENGVAGGPAAHEKMRKAGSQRESPRDTTHTFGNTTVGQGCGRQALAGKARCALRVATLGLWFPSPWQRRQPGSTARPWEPWARAGQAATPWRRPGVAASAVVRAQPAEGRPTRVKQRPKKLVHERRAPNRASRRGAAPLQRQNAHVCNPRHVFLRTHNTGEAKSVGTARGPGERGSERNVPGVSEARRGAGGSHSVPQAGRSATRAHRII